MDSRVAEINAAGAMDIGPNVHNFGSANVDGSEIRVISPDGSSALVHRQGTGSKILRCACFPAGTPVHTPNGTVPIERLQPDDEIMAYDTQKKDTVVSQVRQVARKTWYSLMRIVTPSDTLWATGNPPFYIPALQQYLPADSLRRGMQLLALTGALLTVQSVAAVDTTVSVYNFEVAEHHNYYVGEEGVLVHNTNGTCPLWVAILRKNKPDGGIIDATEGVLDILQTQALRADIVQAFIDGNVDFLRFFTHGLDINNPADLAVAQRRVRAWGVLRDSEFSNNLPALQNIDNNLSYFEENSIENRVQFLRTLFVNAINKIDFIDGFIGGPLLKAELEELNHLYYKQAKTYEVGSGSYLLTPSEAARVNELEIQLGSYEHPNALVTDSPQFIGNTSTEPQPSPDNFWADVKVANGKIEGLLADIKYDYVITYQFDGAAPQLRLGLGHYRISGGAIAVKGAGSLKFNSEGKIYEINRQSGHYISLPYTNLPIELDEIVNILSSNGLTIPNVFKDYSL